MTYSGYLFEKTLLFADSLNSENGRLSREKFLYQKTRLPKILGRSNKASVSLAGTLVKLV